MKVKYSVIPFIPAVIAMFVLRIMSVVGVDDNGKFLGMDRMALSYTVIGIALALFVVCILINIFDRKTSPVYPVKKNFAAGALAILSGLAVVASSCLSLLEITTESEYFTMGVISALFSIPAGIAFLVMSKVHFTGKTIVSGVSILFVFPALWGCTELVFEFLEATKVSISATDLTSLFCYIFITLYYFSHSMVVSRIKGRNPVKACFIYGIPAAALTLSHGVYMIFITMNERIGYLRIVNAVQFIILGCYAISFIVEMFINSYTKDELEIVEALPEGEALEEEEEKYIETKDYEDLDTKEHRGIDTKDFDDLVFSNSASSTDPNVDPSDDYYSSAKGLDDFIMGFDAEDSADKKESAEKKSKEKVKKPKKKKAKKAAKEAVPAKEAPATAEPAAHVAEPEPVVEAEPAFEEPAEEPVVEAEPAYEELITEPVAEESPAVEEPAAAKRFAPEPEPEAEPEAEHEAAHFSPSSELEDELRKLTKKDFSKDESEPEDKKVPQTRIKTSDEEDIEARQKARLSEIDKLLQELDSKSE